MTRQWIRTGRPVNYRQLGICGRNHEDGGTVVRCPPGSTADDDVPRSGSSPTADDAADPRSPPRPPPTADEIPCPSLPGPRLHRDPDHEGVTGMRTWLWADGQASSRSTGTVRGYRVTCTATPQEWRFEPGDGPVYRRGGPGAPPPRQAVEHVYERKGVYTQRLTVRWRLETSAGTRHASRSTTRTYRVVEVRGALVDS